MRPLLPPQYKTMAPASKKTNGFTLIELLVVIAIIGLLSTIITASLGSAKSKSRDAKRIADIKTIQTALALYYNDNGMYPLNIYAASTLTPPSSGLAPTYIAVVPRDPQATGSETCSTNGANGLPGCYHYSPHRTAGSSTCNANNPPIMYHLGAALENDNNQALTQDVDADGTLMPPFPSSPATFSACTTAPSPSAFHGNADACTTTTSAGTDKCYDMIP